MTKSSGTGFFMPRSLEDVAPQLRMRSTGSTSVGTTNLPDTTYPAHHSDNRRHRHSSKRAARATLTRTASLNRSPSGATSAAHAGSPHAMHLGGMDGMHGSPHAMHLGGATASLQHDVPCPLFTSKSPSSPALLPGPPPATCEPSLSSASGAAPGATSSITHTHSCDWLSAACCSSAGHCVGSSGHLSAGSNLQLTAWPEPPGAAVSSWDKWELLDLHPAAVPNSRTPSTSSCSCPTPFVSSAAAGTGPCTPAAASDPLSVEWADSLLLNQLVLQSAVPAQEEVNPTDALIPFCGSADLQIGVAPQDTQQAVPCCSGSPVEMLLQLRADLSAAKMAAEAQADMYVAPGCNLSGSLWGPGDMMDAGSASAGLRAPSATLAVLGGHATTSSTGSSPSALALSSMISLNNSVLNGLSSEDGGLCSSGSLFACCPTLAPAPSPTGQQVVGNEVALAAAAMAQEKLAQLAQLDAMRQQLRQDFVQLLPLI